MRSLLKQNIYALNKNFFFYLLLSLPFLACEKDELTPPTIAPNTFFFLVENNEELVESVALTMRNDTLFGHLPLAAQLNKMVASFEFGNTKVFVNNQPQNSGITENDFRKPVQYEVVSGNGNIQTFHVAVSYFTGLPILRLSTENGNEIETRERYVSGEVSLYGGLFEEDLGKQKIKIRGRGNSTWGFPKKPYQIKFEDKTALLDLPEDRRWVLLANYSDKTMLRNYLALESGAMSRLKWTPNSRFVELFFNDDYRGTYQLTQKVEDTNNRLDLEKDGFLLEVDQLSRLNEDDVYTETERLLFNIKEPKLDFDDDDYKYIKNYLNEVEGVLYSSDFADPENGYSKYLEVESFVEWYLINEIAKNVDAVFYSSVYMHHDRGRKLKMGPLWDFDLGFGNVDYSDARYAEGFRIKDSGWMKRLFEDPAFVAKVKERYPYFYANKSKLVEQVRKKAMMMNLAQMENDLRWGTIGEYVWPNPVVLATYDAEVDYLVNWFENRMDWLAIAIEDL